jgi:hypothetical protein
MKKQTRRFVYEMEAECDGETLRGNFWVHSYILQF